MLTTLCGSLSLHPSPVGSALHRAGYAALGLDFAYVAFRVRDLSGALAGMRALGIRGFGVSMPYKLQVIPELDDLDPLAARIGAVNTIVNQDGRLTGFNTDALGARRALEEQVSLSGKEVVVVGAGGAARAVVFALATAGAHVLVANRTMARAAELARAVTAAMDRRDVVQSLDLSAAPPRAEILVNASSGGMDGVSTSSPVPASWLEAPSVVMDVVYKPLETSLLTASRALGKKTISGTRMLLHQAAAQFELYTCCAAPLEAMETALRAALGEG